MTAKEMELWDQSFGNVPAVGLRHPNIESFFDELNRLILEEDEKKKSTESPCGSVEESSDDERKPIPPGTQSQLPT